MKRLISKQYLYNELITHINNAINEHEPSKVYVAYSGGHDSACVLHLCDVLRDKINSDIHVMTIDTGLGSEGHIERLRKDVNGAGFELEVYKGCGYEWFVQNALEYGFAYSFPHHSIFYRMLKERAIMKCVRENKQGRFDRIGFITGVRRAESVRRSKRAIVLRKGARLSINAIATFTDADKQLVMSDCTWWQGRATEDCMCNWSGKFCIDDLKGTPAHEPVKMASEELKSIGLWGYGDEPTPEQFQLLQGMDSEDMPDDSFCISCLSNK